MSPTEHCVTRNHIEVWHQRVLPPGTERITVWRVLYGSLVPIVVWTGIASFVHIGFGPVPAGVLVGFFVLAFLAGFTIRRKGRHTVRCALYGALGGVLDKSLDGF
ncbi:hypothetical protein [Streptomyces niveus]|uniref:hypothetical protein n=1 Tax=Streptomyces niveus TaxID=193462 RepID=UPI00366551D1